MATALLAAAAIVAAAASSAAAQATGCVASKAALHYVGTQSVTQGSQDCVPWSLTPFAASAALFPDATVPAANNFCRNPGYSRLSLWCYTNATSLEFDSCESVSVCENSCRETESGEEYNGRQGTDAAGNACLSWVSVGTVSSEFFKYDSNIITANIYCRNVPPNASAPFSLNSSPWCFVNSSSPTPSACSVPFCSQLAPGRCRTDLLGHSYRGNVSASVSGSSCVSWSATGAYVSAAWPLAGETLAEAANFCRNPANSSVGLWCYVSLAAEWEPCIVQACEPKTSCPSSSSDYYRYRQQQTYRGCSTWSSVYSAHASTWYSFASAPAAGGGAVKTEPLFHVAHLPDESLAAAGALCRNPDLDPSGPWCPTGAAGKLHCADPCNNVTCLTDHSGEKYIGLVNKTRRGVACQRWLATFPWQHTFGSTGIFTDVSVEAAGAFCRNPNANPWGPWCIKSSGISDSDFWDFCDVPFCDGFSRPAPTSPAARRECLNSRNVTDYAGQHSVTAGGRQCQRWDSQSPHPHPYYLPHMFNELTVADASNFCRNPSHDPNGPWCFTADSAVRFEYCSIVLCYPTVTYPPAVESFLQLVSVLTAYVSLLLTFALAAAIGKAVHDSSSSDAVPDSVTADGTRQRQHESQQGRQHEADRDRGGRASTLPEADGIDDLDDLDNLDAEEILTESQQPPSKFAHSNAVMKAMANGYDADPFADGLQPIEEEEDRQPIVEQQLQRQQQQQQQPQQQQQQELSLESLPPPTPLETETLERRLDFDVESLDSLSLHRVARQRRQLQQNPQQQQQQQQQQQRQPQATSRQMRSSLTDGVVVFPPHPV